MKHRTFPLFALTLMGLLSACSGNNPEASSGEQSEESKADSSVVSSEDACDTSYESVSRDGSKPGIDGYTEVKKAASYKDFPVWKKYKDDHWKILSPYKGKRTDFRQESIYFAMTTRFYDGDKSNNVRCWDGRNNSDQDPAWRGDFKGLIEKMDYIKALGFTAIWITPVVKNASGYDYHGYHAINFSEVDPRYESEDVAFQDVIDEAHKRDMKIVLDVVFNHTGNFGEENLFPMFQKDAKDFTINGMKQKDKSLLPDNYATSDGNSQYGARIDSMKNTSTELKGRGHDDKLIYHHEKNMSYEQYIEQTGQMAGDCVDLNTENPTVCNYLVDCYGQFIRMGVDAFRIDTMKHISRLTFNNYLFPAFKEYATKCGNKNFFMFGEVCTRVREVWNHGQACDSAPFYTWKESKTYAWGDTETNSKSTLQNWNDNANTNQPTSDNVFLKNGAYHTPDHSKWSGSGVIDFPMHWNFQYARDAYNVAVNNDQYYNDASYNVTYVDSHDYGPDGAEKIRYNEGTEAWKENLSLIFTFRGIPCIYYGSEVEFQKGKTIDEGPNLALKDSGRAYFGEQLEGTVKATDFGKYTASGTVKTTLSYSLSKHVQMLNKIRLKVPALSLGQYKSFGDLKFVRRYTSGGKDSVAAVAISGGQTFSGLPNGKYVDLVSGNSQNVSGGTLNVTVSGKGNLAVYVLDNGVSGTLSKIS
ncbi:MAG: glycosidase [Bacilli bacterium]|nr:glycosidase [Bacilli bacterium]